MAYACSLLYLGMEYWTGTALKVGRPKFENYYADFDNQIGVQSVRTDCNLQYSTRGLIRSTCHVYVCQLLQPQLKISTIIILVSLTLVMLPNLS